MSSLGRGDYVLVKPGESIPADGEIVEGETEVDEALLSGESRPLPKRTGERVTGGAVNVTGPVVVRVERSARRPCSLAFCACWIGPRTTNRRSPRQLIAWRSGSWVCCW